MGSQRRPPSHAVANCNAVLKTHFCKVHKGARVHTCVFAHRRCTGVSSECNGTRYNSGSQSRISLKNQETGKGKSPSPGIFPDQSRKSGECNIPK